MVLQVSISYCISPAALMTGFRNSGEPNDYVLEKCQVSYLMIRKQFLKQIVNDIHKSFNVFNFFYKVGKTKSIVSSNNKKVQNSFEEIIKVSLN